MKGTWPKFFVAMESRIMGKGFSECEATPRLTSSTEYSSPNNWNHHISLMSSDQPRCNEFHFLSVLVYFYYFISLCFVFPHYVIICRVQWKQTNGVFVVVPSSLDQENSQQRCWLEFNIIAELYFSCLLQRVYVLLYFVLLQQNTWGCMACKAQKLIKLTVWGA